MLKRFHRRVPVTSLLNTSPKAAAYSAGLSYNPGVLVSSGAPWVLVCTFVWDGVRRDLGGVWVESSGWDWGLHT